MGVVRKHHARTIDKMHILIRLELANPMLSAGEIARLAGVPVSRYAIFKQMDLYQKLHNQYMSGVITRLDKRVDENLTLTKETLHFAVPMAMQNLLKQALQEKDLRVQNKACNDILDRDGHFAKVKRIGLATPDQGGASIEEKDNEAAQQLLNAMGGRVAPQTPNIQTSPITETKQ